MSQPTYQVGDEAVEINYGGRVRVTEVVETPALILGDGHVYHCEAVEWELPPWDRPTFCTSDDLLPLLRRARFDTREVW